MGENLSTPGISPKIDNYQYFLTMKPLTKINFTYFKMRYSNVEFPIFSQGDAPKTHFKGSGRGPEGSRGGREGKRRREDGEEGWRSPPTHYSFCLKVAL